MTDIQIFQFLGLTFFAMGMGMLTDPKFIKNIIKEFEHSTTNVFYGGLACMAIGFPLIAFHNIWNWNAGLIITVLGWLSFSKGLALLMFPTQSMGMYKNVIKKEGAFVGYFVVGLGIVMLYFGYIA